MAEDAPIGDGLVADGIDRSYGRTLALREVRFQLTTGEIHTLVGENGAGKSTLIKVLTGVEQPDRGTIAIGGSEVSFRSPREGRRAGIAVVHQDNQVFEDLTVWENIGGTATRPATWGPLLRRGATVRRVRETLDRYEIQIDPARYVRDIALQERKLLEIARALIQAPRFLLLDEPTAMLTPAESVHLFDLVHRLRQQGLGVVLVTHHLEEVLEHADRTSVLRDGANVGTFERRQLDRSTLVQAMLGGHLEQRPKERSQARAHAALSVAGLQLRGDAPGIDLEVRQGEIVAVVGLLGCGASTLLQRIKDSPVCRQFWRLTANRRRSGARPAHVAGESATCRAIGSARASLQDNRSPGTSPSRTCPR